MLVNCIFYKESIKEIVTGLPLKHCPNGRKNRFGWGSQRAHPKPKTQDSFIKLNVKLKKSGSTKDSFIKLNLTLKKSGSTKDSFIKLNVTLKKSGSTKGLIKPLPWPWIEWNIMHLQLGTCRAQNNVSTTIYTAWLTKVSTGTFLV